MILAAALALLFTFAALKPNATEDRYMEQWDPASRRKTLYDKISKALIENESKDGDYGEPYEAINWPLAHFIDRYLSEAEAHTPSIIPDTWTIKDPTEHYELIKDSLKDERIKKHSNEFEDVMIKDFVKKYEPAFLWDQKEKALRRNDTNLKLLKGLDLTDELLSLNISSSGRLWRNNEWLLPQPAHNQDLYRNYEPTPVWQQKEQALEHNDTNYLKLLKSLTDEMLDLNTSKSGRGRRFWNSQWPQPQVPYDKSVKKSDVKVVLYFMRQAIYHARNRMSVMQQLREEYRATALYKMGYLFAKTDFACKIFSSLAFKAFRDCSMTRMRILGYNRLYKYFMDIAYNIERLLARWFDIDLLKDLLISNDMLARGVLLKDKNLTTPQMVVDAFNEMFID